MHPFLSNMTHVTTRRVHYAGNVMDFIRVLYVQQFPPLVAGDDENEHVSGFGLYPVRNIYSIFTSTYIIGFHHFGLLVVIDDDDDDTWGDSESVLGGYAHSYFFGFY